MPPSQPIFRFAPSPNGYLHLGHAFSALYTAHWAKQMGGRFLLRIEDIDQGRARPDFVDAIFEDLDWLGLKWEEPVLFQSERFALYQAAAARLDRMGLLYPCFCTRADIAAKAERPGPDGVPLYPGTCKTLTGAERADRLAQGRPVQWRLDMDAATARVGFLTYSVAGPSPADRPQIRTARPERWGDVVLKRKDTPTSYHLSVVIDDAEQGVTHVTRGRDLEEQTEIHALLQFLLGLPAPIYTHHRLITDAARQKLAKSKGSTALRDLRAKGWSPRHVRDHLGL